MNPLQEDVPSARKDQQVRDSLLRGARVDLLATLSALRKDGYAVSKLVREMLAVYFGKGGLRPSEYFYYGLHADGRATADKKHFIGLKQQELFHGKCNSPYWVALAENKEVFYAAMQGFGFRVPQTLGVLRSISTSGLGVPFNSGEGLVSFLQECKAFPLFAKPTNGMFSLGAIRINGIDRARDRANVNSNREIRLNELLAYIFESSPQGYLFQKLLEPHATVVERFGTSALPTVRFLILVGGSSVSVASAVYRVPVGKNVADNFWRSGNVLCAIDTASGKISRAVTGTGLGLKEVDKHPDTGKPLVGMALPDWSEAVDLCLRAAGTLPDIHTQSWDIALTSEGPTIVEVNFGGDLNLHQLAHRKGLLQGAYLEHLRANGVKV